MPLVRRRASRSLGRRAIPWMLVLEVLREANAHWQAQLSPRERKRALELVKTSRGLPTNLSPREQQELRDLVGKLDLAGFGRRAALTGAGLGGRRHRP
ncbi:hypothetical protein ACVU7I_05710 [Patulibacter sp. S7RM1-6]